jgi:hypothetical protein
MKFLNGLFFLLIVTVSLACESQSSEDRVEVDSVVENVPKEVFLSEEEKAIIKRDSIIVANQVKIIKSANVVDRDLKYSCRVTISNPTRMKLIGVELIDFQNAGFGDRTANIMLSVKPLQKVKIKVAPRSKATVTFPARSGNVTPQISKIFYSDGTIEHTEYDVLQR